MNSKNRMAPRKLFTLCVTHTHLIIMHIWITTHGSQH